MRELRGEESYCAICIPQVLSLRVQEAVTIYEICAGQLIFAGFDEAVDLSIPAIAAVMDIYKVQDKKTCLNYVLYLGAVIRDLRKEK